MPFRPASPFLQANLETFWPRWSSLRIIRDAWEPGPQSLGFRSPAGLLGVVGSRSPEVLDVAQARHRVNMVSDTNGCGSKPMVPFWGRCTTHFSPFLWGLGCSLGVRDVDPWPNGTGRQKWWFFFWGTLPFHLAMNLTREPPQK